MFSILVVTGNSPPMQLISIHFGMESGLQDFVARLLMIFRVSFSVIDREQFTSGSCMSISSTPTTRIISSCLPGDTELINEIVAEK